MSISGWLRKLIQARQSSNEGAGGFPAFVAEFESGTFEGLFLGFRGEDAPGYGFSGFHLEAHKGGSNISGEELGMGCGSLKDATEGDDSIMVFEEFFGDDGDFPGSGDLDDGDFWVSA